MSGLRTDVTSRSMKPGTFRLGYRSVVKTASSQVRISVQIHCLSKVRTLGAKGATCLCHFEDNALLCECDPDVQ